MINKKQNYKEKWLKKRSKVCHCCKQEEIFCWNCKCGFSICQTCLQQNFWGMSCNGITWVCPDCGDSNGLGNQ
ncbi:MAG: hypothetical protein HQK76_15015 [Desulfobacterales bacterium]|nr:hypothetical protein [Desulfobacterales bacterium]